MSDNKKTSLQRVGNTLRYNDSFEVDLNRFTEVVEQMLPIYKEHEQAYKDYLLFPEFVFKQYFHKKQHREHLANILYLSAYFDHNKRSEHHYKRDMKQFEELVANNNLYQFIQQKTKMERERLLNSINSHHHKQVLSSNILNERKSSTHNSLIGTIYSMNALEQTMLLKKSVVFMALDPIKYHHKISTGNKKNNPLEIFRDSLDTLVEQYDASALNISKDKSPVQFKQDLEKIKGIGPGLSYLTILFYAHAGLVPYSVHEIDGVEPKIDGNDMVIAQMTDILKVFKPINSDATVKPLAKGMVHAAKQLNVSPTDVDLCFWVASQAYRVWDFPTALTTAKPFFTKEEFDTFPSKYYTKGILIPNYTPDGKKIPQKHDAQLSIQF